MISLGIACRRSVCLLSSNHIHLRIHRNRRHILLLEDNCCGSLLFQEANQQCCSTATSTSESVPQTSNYLKNHKIVNRLSSQQYSDTYSPDSFNSSKPNHKIVNRLSSEQYSDTNHSPDSFKLSKPKKYFNVDFNSDSSVDMPQKDQLPSAKSECKKKTPHSSKATVHQLLQLAKQGHIQQAEKVLQQLEASDKFQVGTGVLVSLLGMYLAAEQLPPALATWSRLHLLYPHVALSTPTTLSLATLMMHHGQTSECIKLLADEAALVVEAADISTTAMTNDDSIVAVANSEQKDEKLQKKAPRCTLYSDKLCHRLLMVPAVQGNVSATEDVLEALLCHHYAKPSRAILGPLVQARIASRDWDGALSTLQRLAQEHNCLPCRPELMKALIRLKDADRLQQVVELSAELLGRDHALLDLAICFLESDDTDKATELLQESQITLSPARLQYLCQYYARHRNERCLRHLLTLVRSCGSPQGVQLVCAHLVRVYDEKRDCGKAAELLKVEGITRQELPSVADPAPQRSEYERSGVANKDKGKTRDAVFRS